TERPHRSPRRREAEQRGDLVADRAVPDVAHGDRFGQEGISRAVLLALLRQLDQLVLLGRPDDAEWILAVPHAFDLLEQHAAQERHAAVAVDERLARAVR